MSNRIEWYPVKAVGCDVQAAQKTTRFSHRCVPRPGFPNPWWSSDSELNYREEVGVARSVRGVGVTHSMRAFSALQIAD